LQAQACGNGNFLTEFELSVSLASQKMAYSLAVAAVEL
jgi:hypothetical protein